MEELLRFTARSTGFHLILPPKREFVLYKDRIEKYKNGKLIERVLYSDIKDVICMSFPSRSITIITKQNYSFAMLTMTKDQYNKVREILNK